MVEKLRYMIGGKRIISFFVDMMMMMVRIMLIVAYAVGQRWGILLIMQCDINFLNLIGTD